MTHPKETVGRCTRMHLTQRPNKEQLSRISITADSRFFADFTPTLLSELRNKK